VLSREEEIHSICEEGMIVMDEVAPPPLNVERTAAAGTGLRHRKDMPEPIATPFVLVQSKAKHFVILRCSV